MAFEFNLAFIGALLFVIGGSLLLWRKKRIFDRTNSYGMEQFPDFWSKLRSKAKDAALGAFSFLCLTAGILMLSSHYQDSWGWAVLLPVYLYLLIVLIGT